MVPPGPQNSARDGLAVARNLLFSAPAQRTSVFASKPCVSRQVRAEIHVMIAIH